MLSKGPEPFNAVDMGVVLGTAFGKALGVFDSQMLAVALKGIVPPELVGEVDSAFPGTPPDNVHEQGRRDSLHHLGVNSPLAL